MKQLIFSLFFLFLAVNSALSQVWTATQQWDEKMEEKYQNWVKNTFNEKFFTSKKSKYCAINTDCADMIYSQRIIFAYENKLPISFINNFGGSPKYITNESKQGNKADRKSDDLYLGCLDPQVRSELAPQEVIELKRLKEFLSFYNTSMFSTYTLAFNDTLPVAPEKISPGDLYVAPTENDFHSYLIQDLSIKGYFHLLFDTMTKNVEILNIYKATPTFNPVGLGWGFKRFTNPSIQEEASKIKVQATKGKIADSLIESKEKQLEESGLKEKGFSFEQYKYLGPQFIEKIKSKIGMDAKEEIQETLKRKLENVCTLLKSRERVVRSTLELSDKKYFDKNQCLQEEYFRKYSTPSRDASTMKEIESIFRAWDLYLLNLKDPVDLGSYQTLIPWLKYHHKKYRKSSGIKVYEIEEEARILEKRLCEITIKTNDGEVPFYISDFIKRYNNRIIVQDSNDQDIWVSLLSSNPNDSIHARWGLNGVVERTHCPNYDEKGEPLQNEDTP